MLTILITLVTISLLHVSSSSPVTFFASMILNQSFSIFHQSASGLELRSTNKLAPLSEPNLPESRVESPRVAAFFVFCKFGFTEPVKRLTFTVACVGLLELEAERSRFQIHSGISSSTLSHILFFYSHFTIFPVREH